MAKTREDVAVDVQAVRKAIFDAPHEVPHRIADVLESLLDLVALPAVASATDPATAEKTGATDGA